MSQFKHESARQDVRTAFQADEHGGEAGRVLLLGVTGITGR
jgi:hypothetical protein